MVEIYREGKQESKKLKTPKLRIGKEEIDFVNDEGELISRMIDLTTRHFKHDCKSNLENKGYRTDFAEWGEEGQFVRFLEDVVV